MSLRQAFVLAGGRSSRFGADKARHPVEGVPMALRVAKALGSTGLPVRLVARDQALADLGLPVLVEAPGPVHALSGVLAALEAVGPDGLALLAPCDLPWLDPAAVALLCAADPPCIAVGQPLVAWLPGHLAPTVRAWRDAGAPVRRLVDHAAGIALPQAALRNVNRPSDLGPAAARPGIDSSAPAAPGRPMAHHNHASEARGHKARVWIATVSSTRTLETDTGGPTLARVLGESGHTVVGREILPDDPARIRARVLELAADAEVDAVVLTGGTGISRHDGTVEAVRGVMDRVLPGFGELFRMLSYSEIGSAAMLSRAVGGLVRGLIVFAVPGSSAACELAAGQLIAPELGHLVFELAKEGRDSAARVLPSVAGVAEAADPPVVDDPESEPPMLEGGLHLGQTAAAATPAAPAEDAPPPEGWFATLAALDGTLSRGERVPLPEELEGIAAARQVIDGAGEQGRVTLPQGDYAAFGWPDLRRPDAQVLLIGRGEVVALHRQPAGAGLVAAQSGGLLVHAGRLGRTCEERTGKDYPGEGRLFAVDGSVVYVRDGSRVSSWDGRRVVDQGTTAQATASLLLGWSQR